MADKNIIIKVDADDQSFTKANTLVKTLADNLKQLVDVAQQANRALSGGIGGRGGAGGGGGGGGAGGSGGGKGGLGSTITQPIAEQAGALKSLAGASREALRSLTQTLKSEMAEQQRVLDSYTRTISTLNQKMAELKRGGNVGSREGALIQAELDAAYNNQAAARAALANNRRDSYHVGYIGNLMYGSRYDQPDMLNGDSVYGTIQSIHGRPPLGPWWGRAPTDGAMARVARGAIGGYGLSRVAGGLQGGFDAYQSTKLMPSIFATPSAQGLHMPGMGAINGDFKYAYALQAATLNGRPLADTLLQESIGQGASIGSGIADVAGHLGSGLWNFGTGYLGTGVGLKLLGAKTAAKLFPATAGPANAMSLAAGAMNAAPNLAAAYRSAAEMFNGKPGAIEWDTFNQNTQMALQNGRTDQGQLPFAALDLLSRERDMRIGGARDLLDEGGASAVHGLGFLAAGRGSTIQEAVEIARAASRSSGGYGVSGVGGLVDRVLTLQRSGLSRNAAIGALTSLGDAQASYGRNRFRIAGTGAQAGAAMSSIYGNAENVLDSGLGNLVYGNRVSGAVQDQFAQMLGGVASAGDFRTSESQMGLSMFLSNAVKSAAGGGNVRVTDVNNVMSGLGGLAAGANSGGIANLGALRALRMTGDLYSSRVLNKLTSSPEGIAELLSAQGNLRGSNLTAAMGRQYLGEQYGTKLAFSRAPKAVEELLSQNRGNIFDAYKNAGSGQLKELLAQSLGTLDEFGTTRAAEAALKAGSSTNLGDSTKFAKQFQNAAAEARKGNDGAAETVQRMQEELQNAVRELKGFTESLHKISSQKLLEDLAKPMDEGTSLRPDKVYQVKVVGYGQSRK